ncbi:hypothetical protein NMG46_13390 [Mesorhizobium sp. LMG 17147]|nr:hypothetical protein [Mesorhizobium sp. LMG 17147]MCP9231237.1 hypothetical protein [Mesorhizobium sp. LMG 17147]
MDTTDETIAAKAARKYIVATDDAIDRARALAKAPDYVRDLTPAERYEIEGAGGVEFLRDEEASNAMDFNLLHPVLALSSIVPEDMLVDRISAHLQSLEPQTRLDWYHAGAIPDEQAESAAAEEYTPAQTEYLENLGNYSIADLTAERRDMLDFFGRLRRPANAEEASAEAAKPLPGASVIIGPHSNFDLERSLNCFRIGGQSLPITLHSYGVVRRTMHRCPTSGRLNRLGSMSRHTSSSRAMCVRIPVPRNPRAAPAQKPQPSRPRSSIRPAMPPKVTNCSDCETRVQPAHKRGLRPFCASLADLPQAACGADSSASVEVPRRAMLSERTEVSIGRPRTWPALRVPSRGRPFSSKAPQNSRMEHAASSRRH